MKTLVLLAIFTLGCEHDPRFEKHRDEPRPEPAVAVQPAPEPTPPPVVNKTIERPAIVPLRRRIHRHHH
ncbi:MAG: hypothetical protein ABI704_06750 [Kofleriaceae bacterium]